MPNPVSFLRYLRFWGPDVDADVDEELHFHIESLVAELERRGHATDEARRLARERFGDARSVRRWLRHHDTRQHNRQRRGEIMDELTQDVRYGARKLLTRPGFAAAVIAVFALGIGATSAIFALADAALFRPIAFDASSHLAILEDVGTQSVDRPDPTRSLTYDSVRSQKMLFTDVAMFGSGGLNLTDGVEPIRIRTTEVTPTFFATIGVRPALGRGFAEEEGVNGAPRTAILSDGLWRRQFGADRAVLGRTIHLNDVAYVVVGIMPANFGFPRGTELWRPMQLPYSGAASFEMYAGVIDFKAVARMAPGATLAAAGRDLFARYRRDRPEPMPWDPTPAHLARALRDDLMSANKLALQPLMVGSLLVLLIACANVANLLLASGTMRRREFALRAVLGASRARMVRQLLVETTVLATAGALVGLVLARACLGVLTPMLPAELVAVNPPQIDARVFVVALLAAVVTGIVFGLAPALGAARTGLGEAIKSGGEFGSTRKSFTFARSGLAVAELALALMLLVGAGLMAQSFRTLLAVDPGLRADQAVTMEVTLPRARYGAGGAAWRFYQALFERLDATPGITAAGSSNVLPLAENQGFTVSVQAEGEREKRGFNGHWLTASPGYFEALGVPLIEGRTFTATEDTAAHPAIINKTLAEELWPGQSAVGRRIVSVGSTMTVVGVVGNLRSFGLDRRLIGQVYQPMSTAARNYTTVVVRGTTDPRAMAARMREAVRAVDPTLPVYNVRPMGEVIAASVTPQRTRTLLVVAFGLVALTLAGVGVYGVLAFGVQQRTRELGIRMALGAHAPDVRAMVLAEGVVIAAVGVALGLVGAFALTRFIASQLFGVTATDPRTYLAATLVLFVISIVATYVPARRATTVDPLIALRTE